jgi:hypothetical protein
VDLADFADFAEAWLATGLYHPKHDLYFLPARLTAGRGIRFIRKMMQGACVNTPLFQSLYVRIGHSHMSEKDSVNLLVEAGKMKKLMMLVCMCNGFGWPGGPGGSLDVR